MSRSAKFAGEDEHKEHPDEEEPKTQAQARGPLPGAQDADVTCHVVRGAQDADVTWLLPAPERKSTDWTSTRIFSTYQQAQARGPLPIKAAPKQLGVMLANKRAALRATPWRLACAKPSTRPEAQPDAEATPPGSPPKALAEADDDELVVWTLYCQRRDAKAAAALPMTFGAPLAIEDQPDTPAEAVAAPVAMGWAQSGQGGQQEKRRRTDNAPGTADTGC